MVALLLFIIFGLLFGYFATLNTSLIGIHFGIGSIPQIPVYILVIGSFAFGIVFASLFYFIKSVGVQYILRKKSKEVDDSSKTSAELLKKIHQLELENTRLKKETGHSDIDEESI